MQPAGFVREIGRQMFATFGATLRVPRAEMLARTGTTRGILTVDGGRSTSRVRSPSVQAITKRPGCGCADLADVSALRAAAEATLWQRCAPQRYDEIPYGTITPSLL
jgi:hypothetical protein